MRKEMADNISEKEISIPKTTWMDKALSKVPRRLVRLGATAGIMSGIAAGTAKPSEAKPLISDFRKPGEPTLVTPDKGSKVKEQTETRKVDTLKTFKLTQKEKDMIDSGTVVPEVGGALGTASKALVEEYKATESVTQVEVAYNKDTGVGGLYLRFTKDTPINMNGKKEETFTAGSVIYSGGHYMVQKEGQIVSPVIVDDKTKNFFEEVNTEDGKVQSPKVGSIIIVAKDAKTGNIDSFITGDKRYDMTDIKDAPSFQTPDAPRAKMGEGIAPEKPGFALYSKDDLEKQGDYTSGVRFTMPGIKGKIEILTDEKFKFEKVDVNAIAQNINDLEFSGVQNNPATNVVIFTEKKYITYKGQKYDLDPKKIQPGWKSVDQENFYSPIIAVNNTIIYPVLMPIRMLTQYDSISSSRKTPDGSLLRDYMKDVRITNALLMALAQHNGFAGPGILGIGHIIDTKYPNTYEGKDKLRGIDITITK